MDKTNSRPTWTLMCISGGILRGAVGCLMLMCVSNVVAEETLYSVLEKHLQARGGLEAWKSIDTVRMTGDMSFAEGQSVPVVMEIRRPNLLRFEFELGGEQVIQGFDGDRGWLMISDGISIEIEDMPPEQAQEFARTADFDGPLIDWREKAYSLRYLGLKLDAEPSGHWLEVTRPGGERLNIILDEVSFLTRQEQVFSPQQTEQTEQFAQRLSTSLSDYREVAGVHLPFRYEITLLEQGTQQQLNLDSIEMNVPLSESRFQKPVQ